MSRISEQQSSHIFSAPEANTAVDRLVSLYRAGSRNPDYRAAVRRMFTLSTREAVVLAVIVTAAVTSVLLSGCAATMPRSDAWVGRPVSELIAAWGSPQSELQVPVAAPIESTSGIPNTSGQVALRHYYVWSSNSTGGFPVYKTDASTGQTSMTPLAYQMTCTVRVTVDTAYRVVMIETEATHSGAACTRYSAFPQQL